MDSKINLEKFYQILGKDSRKAREEILKLNYSKDGYLLQCLALTYRDEAMFFKNGNRKKIYILDKLYLSKKYIDKAFKILPNCLDVLFLKGTIYHALNKEFDAMDCYIKIIENGINLSYEFNCSEKPVEHVKMVINDAHLMLYQCFRDLGNRRMARKFLNAYKEELKKGVDTVYLPLKSFL